MKVFFQDNVLDGYLIVMDGVAKSFTTTAVMALLITCMGILGVVALTIVYRLKEISIHKILGASMYNIIHLISKGFMTLLIIGAILGIPFGYFITNLFLDSLWQYYHVMDVWPSIFAFVLVGLSALVTVYSQVYKVAISNPVDALRNE